MREILFRAKRIDNGEWREGYLVDDGTVEKEHYFVTGLIIEPYKGTADDGPWVITGIEHLVEIDPETICQYTGLKDKNGNRIWENDIVDAWSEGKHAIGKVKRRIDGLYIIYPAYQKQEFWGLCPDENGKTTVEVIGNIFDGRESFREDTRMNIKIKQGIDNCHMVHRYEHPGYENDLCAGLRTMNGDGEPCDTCKECYLYYGHPMWNKKD